MYNIHTYKYSRSHCKYSHLVTAVLYNDIIIIYIYRLYVPYRYMGYLQVNYRPRIWPPRRMDHCRDCGAFMAQVPRLIFGPGNRSWSVAYNKFTDQPLARFSAYISKYYYHYHYIICVQT